jgi:hypothetical protein
VGLKQRKNSRTVAAKLPESLIVGVDRIAQFRGVSRSFVIRELVEAAVEGRVIWPLPPRARGMTLAELATSDVAAAARRAAQHDAAGEDPGGFLRSQAVRLVDAPIAVAAIVAGTIFAAGCGGNGGGTTTTGGSATATTTGSVKQELHSSVDKAVSSCRNSAQQISGEAARNIAQTACNQVGGALDKQLASVASSAQGNLNSAVNKLAKDCRESASSLPSAAKAAALQACDALTASSGGG